MRKRDREHKYNNKMAQLTIQANKLQQELQQLQGLIEELHIEDHVTHHTLNLGRRGSDDIRVGDRVVVKNNHRALRNITDRVISVTEVQVTVKLENGTTDFRRYKKNLSIIKEDK